MRTLPRLSIVSLAVAGCWTPATWAGLVTLGADPSSFELLNGDAVARARYRLSTSSWDQAIITGDVASNTTLVGSGSFGHTSQLNGAVWDFTLSYDPLAGYSWVLEHAGGGSPTSQSRTITWTTPHNGESPTAAHNAIQLQVSAGPSFSSSMRGAGMAVGDLVFSAAGSTLTGSLGGLWALWSPAGGSSMSRWIYSDTNLATTNWSLSGKVFGAFWATGNGNPLVDDRLKFDVATYAAVPAPAAGMIVLSGVAWRGRSHRR